MIFDERKENCNHRRFVCLGTLLLVSLLINLICFFQWVLKSSKEDREHVSEDLREMVFQQASISIEDVGSFIDCLYGTDYSSSAIFALIPPFACSQCITTSLKQLTQHLVPIELLIPEGYFTDALSPMTSSLSTIQYQVPESQNPVCYYPDLVLIITRNNRVVDFFLHTKDVPEAMAVFLSHSCEDVL